MQVRPWPPKGPATLPRRGSITAKSSPSPITLTRHGLKLPTRKRSCKSAEAGRMKRWATRMKAPLLPILLGILATPVRATQPLQVIGYSGYLGEWELTATVTETAPGSTAEYSGPLTMKHVGICTQD